MNLIVFDIDDTLTQSVSQHQHAYVQAMKVIGITDINQNWKAYKHHTDSYILKENYESNFKDRFDPALLDNFENRMVDIMSILEPVKAISGAGSFVDFLRNEKNYALTFATGSLLAPALFKLEQAGIWHAKELIVAANRFYERELIVSEAIEKARQYYKVSDFENIISIGDGIWDMQTAINLGLGFIGVGLKNYADFVQAGIEVHTENWENFDFEIAENQLLRNTPVKVTFNPKLS